MTALVILMLLGQVPDGLTPPPPPPQPEAELPLPPPPPAGVAAPEGGPAVAPAAQNSAVRFAATFGGALVGGLPALLVVLAAPVICVRQDPSCEDTVAITTASLAPLSTALGAFLAHRLTGGTGTFGKAVVGSLLGWGTSMVALFALDLAVPGISPQVGYGLLGVASLATFAVTAGMLEYSHRSQAVGVSIVPVSGGGVVSVGGSF